MLLSEHSEHTTANGKRKSKGMQRGADYGTFNEFQSRWSSRSIATR